MYLARHAHGLVDDNLPPTDPEEDRIDLEMEEPGLSGVSQLPNDSREDEASEGSDSSESDTPNSELDSDSESDACF